MLNGISPEIFFTAATRVPPEFRVRQAVRRVYRYVEPIAGADVDRRRRAAQCFEGVVDVRSFARGVPSSMPTLRSLESIRVTPFPGSLVTEVRGASFVWGMVRKIVSALRAYDAGRVTLDSLAAAVAGTIRLSLPLAEPEGLILWEVEFPLAWEWRWDGPNRRQAAWSASAQQRVQVESEVLRRILEEPDGSNAPP